jgi:hypothetical protein
MNYLLFLPFFLQTLIITLDEFVFHVKRGLPKWERLGHPLDTLTVVACFAYVAFVPYSALALKIYIGMAIFSCIFVTKDEFVHKEHCPAPEQWLHAILFLNHPVVLTCAGLLWGKASTFLTIQAGLAVLFGLYQLVYWNLIWKERSTTPSTKI